MVRERIRRAATACGRDPGDVTLLAVSKTKPLADVIAAYEAGQRLFGENYLQDALPKILGMPASDVEWHFIGRIQGNKTAEISRHFSWVHGLDRVHHAEQLSRYRPAGMADLQVCLQVNLSAEASKGGVAADQLPALARAVADLPRLRLRGLMTMPDPHATNDALHAAFSRLRHLRDRLNAEGSALDTLSMGMSGDLETAIAEGATIVRIGTDLFGARD